ncbi:DUF4406 domain-containing protein [Achromobacter sp. DH1f]|uniref:DUF4406 domain-containing protein n=1 Tax=Achromobacter sp. DH1f TaxID=1397275 RepID=UPI0004A7F748|nr:DUF4406 domain-containing protein [Achromobacter sp. DH1f]
MRTYLAGPMSGYPELNFPLFHAEAKRLRECGHDVVNPAEINSDPAKDWTECMRSDIAALVTCDAIAMLPGWAQSRGALLEHHIATQLGLVVIHLAPSAER